MTARTNAPSRPRCRRRGEPAFWLAVGVALALIGSGLWLTGRAAAQNQTLDLDGDRSVEVEEHVVHGHGHGHHDNPLADVPFELRLDLRKAYASPIGEMVMDFVRAEKPNVDELMAGVTDTIGLDPRTAIGEVVLRGEGMNEMEMQLIADLGDTTGKLEGWMLTLPGYDSEELDDNTLLHTFLVDDNPEHTHHDDEDIELGHDGEKAHRVWLALPKGKDGRFTLVASFDENATVNMAESVIEGEDVDDTPGLAGDEMLALRVHDLGEHGLPHGAPGSAVLESVETLTLKLGSGADVTASVAMETTSPGRARQVSQLLQGLIALSQLAAIEEPQAQPVADFLSHVRIDNTPQGDDSASVSASFRSSHEQFEEWLEFLMDNAH